MNSGVEFLWESTLMLGGGSLIYVLFLRATRYSQANRMYLLMWPLLATLLALLHIRIMGPPLIVDTWPELMPSGSGVLDSLSVPVKPERIHRGFSLISWILPTYLLGVTISGWWLFIRLARLIWLVFSGTIQKSHGLWVVFHCPAIAPASFGPVLFWKNEWPLDGPILAHEQVHIRQWHTLDRLLIELMRVVHWYNPLLYWMRRELSDQHEFIADAAVTRQYPKYNYARLLLKNQKNRASYQLVAPFSNHLKKRLKMLNHPTVRYRWRYFLVLPLFLACCAFFPLDTYREVHWMPADSESLGSVVEKNDPLPFTNSLVQEEVTFFWPLSPVHYKFSSGFGRRIHPLFKKEQWHTGIDILAPEGVPVVSSASGEVTKATYGPGFGHHIIIQHAAGYSTLYAHLAERLVEVGEKVEQNVPIGKVGNTGKSVGPHLHFEIRKEGKPVDPETLLPGID